MAAPGNRLPKLICLAGFMGCGKTTVGRQLARQLGWHFVDLDSRIEEHTRLRIAEIFDRLGEPAFRDIEYGLLVQALGEVAEQGRSTVLALGGGTFAQSQNLELLRGANALVIWLDCPIEELLARCVTMTNRPLFRDEASFRQLYEQRLPFYRQAHYRVEGSAPAARVVEHILSIVGAAVKVPEPSAGPVNA